MHSIVFCAVAMLATGQAEPAGSQPGLYQFNRGLELAIRGQSPPSFMDPPPATNGGSTMQFQPFQADPVAPYGAAPQPIGPTFQDPFMVGPGAAGMPPGYGMPGVNGPQPYRFGFTPRMDFAWIAPAGAKSPGIGNFSVTEYNFDLRYASQLAPELIFANTPQFNARSWAGPSTPELPGAVYRFGWDFELASTPVGPWSFQLNFNPSVNTDFDQSVSGDAYNFDGSGMVFYRPSQEWLIVLGVGYWDRVDDILLPYAGVVWTPDDRWELRLVFPKPRISYFVGTVGDAAHWLYVSGEYHVESYQIGMTSGSPTREQIQLTDWRIMAGLRSDHGYYDKFIEAGVVLGRQVDFKHGTPGFDMRDSFIVRGGIKF